MHGHGATVLHAENRIEPAEMEARARAGAQHFGHEIDGLKALHLPLEAIEGLVSFKVDAAGQGVIPLELPDRHRRRFGPGRRTTAGAKD